MHHHVTHILYHIILYIYFCASRPPKAKHYIYTRFCSCFVTKILPFTEFFFFFLRVTPPSGPSPLLQVLLNKGMWWHQLSHAGVMYNECGKEQRAERVTYMIYTDCYIRGNGVRFGGHVPFFWFSSFRLFECILNNYKKKINYDACWERAGLRFSPSLLVSLFFFWWKNIEKKKKGFQFLCTVQPAYALPFILSPPPRLVRTSCTLRGVLGHKGSTAYSYIGQLTSYILRWIDL